MKAMFEKYSSSGSLPSLRKCKQIKQLDEVNLYFFRLVNSKKEILLCSEGHISVEQRDKDLAAVKVYSGSSGSYERISTPDNKWQFILHSSSGKIIGTSPLYDTKATMDAVIDKLTALAPNAVIVEYKTVLILE